MKGNKVLYIILWIILFVLIGSSVYVDFISKSVKGVSYILLGQILLGVFSAIATLFLCKNKKNYKVLFIAFLEILFVLGLVILNTVGGDVESGLAIAEGIKGLSKPTVSVVLGGGHSIGVPIAVAADYTLIAPSATMTIHPVRLTGMVIGVPATMEYLERMQDRVVAFVTANSKISEQSFRNLMMTVGELSQDIGTVVVGKRAVELGLIDDEGSIKEALAKLNEMIEQQEKGEAH